MHCGNCSHENETNAKFCSECGAPLALRCPSCDAVQPSGSKFCNQCGTSITARTPETSGVQPSEPAAVRKNVTALFGDLVGSTSFGEQVDPETARAAMAGYFELLRLTIEDHAGTVVKFMGDGVLAVFGIPEVAEDDALRAVAAGNELQQRFRSFADTIRERHGVELGLRVGVNTGELVIGADDADLVGDVLNTAARLEAACQPGRVLVGEDTWRLTRSSVAYEVLGEIRVKGKADPIATFQVVSDIDRAIDEVTPFVGRHDELAGLHAVFAEACDSGTARLATVIGAPGVGKTRLAAELRAAHHARSFDLRFERRGSTTFTPIADLLRELTGTGSADDVARLVADHAEATRLADILSALLGHGDARSTEESFWAVRRLLEVLTLDDPVIIVVDDIQWAEPLFWDLLDHLVEWTAAPVLIVALARPELRELKPELAQAGKRVSLAVALEGLDASTTRELAARLLDTDELPGDLIDRLPESTQGNPLFVRELVQMLVDDGVLARAGERWRLTIDADAIEVPPTILSLLASRVERLPDDERQVVELASVIGTEFDRGALTALAGAEIASRLGALIDRLRRKDLVEPSGSWAGDHPVYRFHHVLIRDAAYRRLLKAHRADLHERVGLHLESAEASNELDVVIAHHYEQVHAYRSDLGTLDDSTRLLAAQASMRLKTAAELALAREDLSSSGGYAMRALALTDDRGERDELLVLGCEALLSSGDVARGAPLVEELAGRTIDARLSAWADCFRAQLWSLTDSDRLSEASELADAAAGRMEGLDDQAGVAKARLVRASTLARLGRVGDCEAELDLALGAARAAGDRRRTVAVLGAAPLAALWGPSPVARAGGRCLDVLRLLRITTSSPAVEATSVRCQGMLEALRGRFDSAREKFETSRTTARDLGLKHGLYETELFEGFVELIAGDPVAAEPHLVLARDGLGALGIGADAGQARALLARALLRQGRIEEADVLASAALEAAGENLQTAVASRSVLGEIRVEQGRPDEARRLIAAALAIVERTDITIDHAIAQRSAARVAGRLGNANDAQAHRAAAERLLADKGVTGLDETRSERAVADTSAQGETADDGETQRAAMLPPNAAWEVNEGLWSTWIADDRTGYLQLLAPDFQARIHELGPKLAFSGDRSATADVLFGSLADDRVHAIPNRLIARRGDDLALIAMTFRDGASSTTMYTVSQVSDGRAVRADTFAEDQLGEALDELDRRWVALGAPADPVEALTEGRRASAEGDYARFRRLLADDFEAVNHGRLRIIDRRSADDFVESMHPLYGNGGMSTPVFADIPAITDGVALTRFHLDTAGGGQWRQWYLWVWESGRLTHADTYDLDAYDAALARFEELSGISLTETQSEPATRQGSSPRGNTASRVAAQISQAILEGDDDALLSLMHADYSKVSPVPMLDVGSQDRSQAASGFRDLFDRGVNVDSRLVAVRGDDLCLVAYDLEIDGWETIRHMVVRTVDGLAWSATTFGDGQLHDALDELDRQWTASGGRADPVVASVARSMSNGPFDAYADCFAPDFVCVDHRALGFGVRSRDEWLDSTRSLGGQVTLTGAQEYLDIDDGISLSRVEMSSSILDSIWQFWLIDQHDGERAVRWEEFAIDQRSRALARYRELAGTAASVPRVPANAATGLIDEYTAAINDGDLDRFCAAFHPDARHELHQRLQVADVIDADGIVGLGRSIIAGKGALESDPVAIFGDHLAVCTQILRFGPDEIRECSVVELDGGLITRVVRYDDDQLVEALDSFTRRAVDLGRPEALGETEIVIRGAHWRHDVDAFKRALDPSWAFDDHRRLGLGPVTREQYLASSFPTGPGEVVYWTVEVLAHTDSAWLAHDRWLTADGSGWDQLHVGVFHSGAAQSSDTFDLVDFDAARACYDARVTEAAGSLTGQRAHPVHAWFDDMTSAGRAGRPLTFSNLAWEASRELVAAHSAGDRVRCASRLADDMVWVAHDPIMQFASPRSKLDREGWLDVVFHEDLAGAGHVSTAELVAIRGETLCLHLTAATAANGDVTDRIYLVEIDVAGLCTRIDSFRTDQLGEAYDELDHRYLDTLPIDHETVVRARHWYTTDRDVFAAILHPRFRFRDHRKLAWPDADRDVMLEYIGTLPPGSYATVPEIFRVTDRDFVIRRVQFMEEGTANTDSIVVGQLDDGLLIEMDWYEPDDLDAALARYEEPAETGAPLAPEMANRGSAAWVAFGNAWRKHGLGAVRSFLDADFRFESRRASAPMYGGDRDDYLSALSMFEDEGIADDAMEVIAVRGDHLALCEILFVTAAGDEFRVLSLCKSTDDGTAIRATTFDPHQLDEALDELDRQWIQLGGPRQNVELGAAIAAALRRGDVEQVRLMLTDDYVDIDHRPLGMGRRTADEWLASLPQQDGRHDAVRIVALVVAHTDDTWLTRSVLSDGTDDVRWEFWSIGQRIGDLAARNETFAIDDYAAAKARYDELVTTHSTTIVASNHASELMDRSCRAMEDGGIAAHAQLLHDDFVFEVRRTSALQYIGGREEWLAAARFWVDDGNLSRVTSTRIATRGDRLLLGRVIVFSAVGDEWVWVHVTEIADGKIRSVVTFDDEQLDDAFDELDRQWLELGGPARVVDLTRRYCNIFGRGTFVELNELIAPGFVAIDHRPLGLGVRSRETWLESVRDLVGHTDVVVTEYLRVRDRHVLTRGSFVLRTDGSILVDGLVLTGYTDDGQFDLMELFAADQLDSAHQRLDELASSTNEQPPSSQCPEPANEAWRIVNEVNDAAERGDRPRLEALLDERWVSRAHDRQDLIGTLDREQYIDIVVGGDTDTGRSLTLLAVRGDDLCLFSGVAARDGYELNKIALARTQAGRAVSTDWFGEDQLDDALDELDRQWVEFGGP